MNLHTGPERPPEAESERGVALRRPADADAVFGRPTRNGAGERRAMRLVFEAGHGRLRTESPTRASFSFTLPLTAAEVAE